MGIDFSKAPEGATHYSACGDFYKHGIGTMLYCDRDGEWSRSLMYQDDTHLKPIPALWNPLTSVEDAPVNRIGGHHNQPRPPHDIPECATVQQPTGSKHDSGKPLIGAAPPNALLAVANVLTFGAQKYGRDNWRQVENAETRYMDATLRHINAYQRGEQLDPESGENHLAHAVCSLMFILEKDVTASGAADVMTKAQIDEIIDKEREETSFRKYKEWLKRKCYE